MAGVFCDLSAAAEHVADGATLALGGMTLYRRPVAFVAALLASPRPPRDLTLLNFTAGFESDLLVGAGCVATVRSVYFGLEAFGLAPMFTRLATSGAVRVMDETEASLVCGLRAQMAGIGFMPSSAWQGTDLLRLRPDVKTITDPYTGRTLTAFPSISIDVAVLHGLEADEGGNVKLNQNIGIDLELVYTAQTVICTVERVVPRLQKSADGVIVPAPGVDFIALAPRGASPSSCHPLYAVDGEAIMRYVDACNNGQFDDYLREFLAR